MNTTYSLDRFPTHVPDRRYLHHATEDCGQRWTQLGQAPVFQWSNSVIRRLREAVGIGRPVMDHRASWLLPDDLSSVPAGRRLIHAQLAEWDIDHQTDLAELLVDELLTNALRHARGKPVLVLSLRDDVLRCAVEDETSTLPHAESPGSCEESGRGLQIVDLLSHRWGVELTRTGKAVWFEICTD